MQTFGLKPRNRPAAHVVTAANLRKRLVAVIAAMDRLALLVLGELRPSFTPRALARSRPSLVRARINSGSNSPKPPEIVNIS
ncbi:MAG TPA: hypothetical protein VEK34_13480 [Methylocella sp.]|nr:hypothetical protein [Methylocella sp.]